MTPAHAALDPRDLRLANAVLGGDDPVRPWVGADGFGLSPSQAGAWVVFAMLWCAATLRRTIAVVVALGPEEQVVDVDAGGVVAVMENAQAVGDRAMHSFPGQAVGLDPQATDPLTDVASGTTLSDSFNARGHDFDPTFGGMN